MHPCFDIPVMKIRSLCLVFLGLLLLPVGVEAGLTLGVVSALDAVRVGVDSPAAAAALSTDSYRQWLARQAWTNPPPPRPGPAEVEILTAAERSAEPPAPVPADRVAAAPERTAPAPEEDPLTPAERLAEAPPSNPRARLVSKPKPAASAMTSAVRSSAAKAVPQAAPLTPNLAPPPAPVVQAPVVPPAESPAVVKSPPVPLPPPTDHPVPTPEPLWPYWLAAAMALVALLEGMLLFRRKHREAIPATPVQVSARLDSQPISEPQLPPEEPARTPTPTLEPVVLDEVVTSPEELDPSQAQLNMTGDLDAFRVPLLLQLIASQDAPGTLVIQCSHSEKRLHFRTGKISSAVSLNRAGHEASGFLMNKLGYLLIRQGKISEAERDQALEFCELNPSKRIGEALIDLGIINRSELRDALRRQAEGVIFSLFIFPEGQFEFLPGDKILARDDDLGIDVEDLLEEANRHEAEWAKLRRTIPILDTVLEFAAGGREKLNNARVTVHQKLVLSLVDGHRSIQAICIESTMLDFEVYNFLYLMVNARILKPVDAGIDPSQGLDL